MKRLDDLKEAERKLTSPMTNGGGGAAATDPLGGVDLSRKNLNLEVQGESISLGQSLAKIGIDIKNFQGFNFQILAVKNIESPAGYLGLAR